MVNLMNKLKITLEDNEPFTAISFKLVNCAIASMAQLYLQS